MPSRDARPAQADDPIWVEDRHGTGLPYSKGLMAASIMATGLPPQRAYELAVRVEHRLAHRGVRRICSDELMWEAAKVLVRHEGPGIAERYLAWRRAKRSPRPVVVLIGGATGVGKSTVATKLAARLDLPRVTPTDSIRQVMRSFLSPDVSPEIHRSSFEGDGVSGFMAQAETVASGVMGVVERAVTERTDLIVEGVHVTPGLLGHPRMERLRSDAVIVQVLMVIDWAQIHLAHFLSRVDNQHGRNPNRYLASFDDIRQVQAHLVALAHRHGVRTVDASDLDRSIQSVIDLVVADVTAIEELEAAAG